MADASLPRRRRWPAALLAVVGVLVLAWFGAAWYFTGVLYDDALRVEPQPAVPVPETEVLAVADGTITLAAGPDTSSEVGAAGAWGLWWADGYGRLGDVESATPGEVTRAFAVLDGAAPGPGTPVDVDKYLYGEDPDDVLGLDWHEVAVPGPIGELDAWLVPGDDAGTWAVLVHGKGAGRDEMLRMLRPVHDAGLTALVITYRGDRDQPVDPAGVYRYGATEWSDLDAAVRFAVERGAEDLVLAGTSTGAAVIASWLDEVPDAPRPLGLVVDAPNVDVERTFAYGASQRTVPGTPVPLPPGLSWTAFRLAELRFPLDLDAVDFSDTLARADVPVLVVHGTGDLTVPVDASRDLVAEREASSLPTTYLETGATEHVGSYNHDPEGYARAVGDFLDAVVD